MDKVIASDYDGTLNIGGIVGADTINAIQCWQKGRNLFGLVTGRSISGILPEIERFSIPYDFIICNNGCEIYNKDNMLLFRAPSNPSVLRPLCEHIIAFGGLHIAISSNRKRHCVIYGEQQPNVANPSAWNSGDVWISLDRVSEFEYFTQADTHFDLDEQAAALAEQINLKFKHLVTAHQNGLNVDIVPPGVSKPFGLYKLLELTKACKEQLITVGDNLNDLSMLKEFDGYAIKSGNPAVVNQISRSCVDIAELIERKMNA